MATQGFRTIILFTVFLGLLVIISTSPLLSNYSQILSYEVTDQNSEGVFSSLSRDFDKTIEEINNDDSTQEGDGQDSPINTARPNEQTLRNSSSTSNTQNLNTEVSNATTSS